MRATLAGCPHHLLCLRLLVFRGASFSVATPKKRGLFTRSFLCNFIGAVFGSFVCGMLYICDKR